MWTNNYNNVTARRKNDIPSITMSDTLYMQSTNISNHQCNFHHHQMDFCMPRETLSVQLPTSLPFQNITYIKCHLAYPRPWIISFIKNSMVRIKRSKF